MNVTGFRVLVAEDEQTFGLTVTRFLQKAGHEVKICTNGKSVLKALDSAEWDVLLLDLKLPDADGVDILARVRKEHPELQTIIVTGFANVQSAIDTMRLGAFDYLTKPPNFEELGMRVEKAGEKTLLERENRRLRFQVQRNLSSDILTRSPVLQKVLRTIEMVAAARTPVLIEGESGVGKELRRAARSTALSPRGDKAVRRARTARRVPATLLESELFGYERGAFTGAGDAEAGPVRGGRRRHAVPRRNRRDDAASCRSKLLRVLDAGTFYRVGAHPQATRVDVRLVCATNRDLEAEVRGRPLPRGPVLPRSTCVTVVIPPLRERPRGHPAAGRALHEAAAEPEALHAAGARGARPSTTGRATCASCTSRSSARGLLAEGDMIDVADLPPEIVEKTGRVSVSMPAAAPNIAVAGGARRRGPRRRRRRRRAGPREGPRGAREGQVAPREGRRDPRRLAADAVPLDQATGAVVPRGPGGRGARAPPEARRLVDSPRAIFGRGTNGQGCCRLSLSWGG